MLGPFQIVKRIGFGGMGEVYEAFDAALNRKVAIKILTNAALDGMNERERFLTEGRALAKLDHPSVVKLHLLGEYEGRPYMAMEFVNGVTLDKYIHANHCGLKELIEIFIQIAEGAHAAHTKSIIHRDLKPQNIMVDAQGRPRIVDFGIAKVYTDESAVKTSMGLVVGTRSYVAPELLTGAPPTAQADVYSLGLVFQFMITGEAPRDEVGTRAISMANEERKRLHHLLPPQIKSVLLGMTQRNPSLRYLDLSEALKDLKSITLDEMPADLLVEAPTDVVVKDLEQAYAHCKRLGLDIPEARLAVNLATTVLRANTDKTAVIEGARQVILDSGLLKAAAERVHHAKTQVIARRASAPSAAKPAEPTAQARFRIRIPKVAWMSAMMAFSVWNLNQNYDTYQKAIEKKLQSLVVSKKKMQYADDELGSRPHLAPSSIALPLVVPPEEILAKAPAPMVGQTFKFSYRQTDTSTDREPREGTLNWELVEIKNRRMYWEDEDGTTEVYTSQLFTPPLLATGNRFRPAARVKLQSESITLFPLSTGKTLTIAVQPLEAEPYDWTCEVGLKENVVTAAGNFEAVRVNCSASTSEYSESYLYAPKMNHWVQRETFRRKINGELRTETKLIGYTLPERRPAATTKTSKAE